jgi:hypothetical protein
MIIRQSPKVSLNLVHSEPESKEAHIVSVVMQVHQPLMSFTFAQSMPITAPTAASIPAAQTSKVAKAPFDDFVLVAEAPLPLAVPEPEPDAEAEGLSEGVADAGGYDAPNALTSNGSEVA